MSQPQSGGALVGGWGTNLFGCFSDIGSCIAVWCCPCFVEGCVFMKAIDDNKSKGWLACCLSACSGILVFRFWYAVNNKLPHDPWTDCILGCCCPPCALCQEYRWVWKQKGNVDKKSPIEAYKETLGKAAK